MNLSFLDIPQEKKRSNYECLPNFDNYEIDSDSMGDLEKLAEYQEDFFENQDKIDQISSQNIQSEFKSVSTTSQNNSNQDSLGDNNTTMYKKVKKNVLSNTDQEKKIKVDDIHKIIEEHEQSIVNRREIIDTEFNAYYDPPFSKNQDVPFSFICDAFDAVSKTKGENSKEKIIDILSNMFRSIITLKPEHLIPTYYFCIFRISPEYEGKNDIGVGGGTLMKAISKTSGRSEKQLHQSVKTVGDLGLVAAASKYSQSNLSTFFGKGDKVKRLTLVQVLDTFKTCSQLKGQNSNNERERLITKLFSDARDSEPVYLVRFFEKNFRIGALEATMQMGLTKAFMIYSQVDESLDNRRKGKWSVSIPGYEAKFEKFEKIIEAAISQYPNYDELINGLLHVGPNIESLLEICKATPGVPLKPMLAQPTKGVSVVFKRFENTKFTCEYKYDGLRGQIHFFDGKFTIYSRRLENLTDAYPDVINYITDSCIDAKKNYILDTEIVAINMKTEQVLPFQLLTTRLKKSVDLNSIEIQVCVFVFDLIYLNDQPLLNKSLKERRQILKENFKEVDKNLRYVQSIDTESFEEVEEFLYGSVKAGAEGLMVKDISSNYEPNKRSWNWLKLKKDYIENSDLGDSFDLVPIGAYYGNGKRAGVFGCFLMACWNSGMERYETFCVTGRGITDEKFKELFEFFNNHKLEKPLPEYNVKNMYVDVWLQPCVVWEIKGSDIQLSPMYTAAIGQVDEHRGFGLRFPRIINYRIDKNVTDATDSTQIAKIYKSQAAVMNAMNLNPNSDDEY